MIDFSTFIPTLHFFLHCFEGHMTPFAYLPMRAMAAGISEEDAAFLLSIMGISGTIGQILIGVIVDKKWLDATLALIIASCIGGILTALVPLYYNYAMLAVYCAVLGQCYGKAILHFGGVVNNSKLNSRVRKF